MERMERLLDLVHILHISRDPVPFESLKNVFSDYQGPHESARRKFERDKAELSALGIAVEYVNDDELSGYILRKDKTFLPPLKLSAQQRSVLNATLSAALLDIKMPFRDALRRAALKLNAAKDTLPGLDLGPASAEDISAATLENLFTALLARKTVTFFYRKESAADDAPPQARKVDVHRVFLRQGHWYVVGFDHDRRAARVFRCARIDDVEQVNRHGVADYELPDDKDVPLLVPAHLYAVHAPYAVRVRVDEEVAFLMFDAWGDDEAGLFEFEVSNIDAVVDSVLRLGSRAELLSPPSARARIKQRLDAVMSHHQELA